MGGQGMQYRLPRTCKNQSKMLQNYGTVSYKQPTIVTRKTESAGHQGMDGTEQFIHTFSVENEALSTCNLVSHFFSFQSHC